MAFGRSSRFSQGEGGHGDELMITPLLDLFVALVPFLIISAVMTRINVVDVGISKPVTTQVSAQTNDLDLLLKVSEAKAEIFMQGRLQESFDLKAGESALNKVHAKLIEIKQKHPDEFKLRIEPQGAAKLDLIMALMDVARKLKAGDPEILKKNEKGETLKLQYLFPNVILKGVYT